MNVDDSESVAVSQAPGPSSTTGGKQKSKPGSGNKTEWVVPKKVCRVANTPANFSVCTVNSFSILSDKAASDASRNNENVEADHISELQTQRTEPAQRDPPPIVVSGVTSTIRAVEDLKAAGIRTFSIQKVRDGIKIFPADMETHSNIKTFLTHSRTQFHTYSTGNRPQTQKFVLYGLDVDHDIEDVKTTLEEKARGILDVRRLRKSDQDGKKTDLPIVLLTTTMDTNISEIAEIRHINYVRFHIKPYKGRQSVLQCYRCQQFGHTKNYCARAVVCVRCAGTHLITECPRQTTPLKCVNCKEAHVASFSGCKVRIAFQERIQKLRERLALKKPPSTSEERPAPQSRTTPPRQTSTYHTNQPAGERAHPTPRRTQQTNEKTYANVASQDVTPPWVEHIMQSIKTLTESTNKLLSVFADMLQK